MENKFIKGMQPVEFANQRVMTVNQIAAGLECPVVTLKMIIKRRRKEFVKGVHYFKLTGETLRQFKSQVSECILADENQGSKCTLAESKIFGRYTAHLLLWTCQGVARLSKLVDTPKAWELFTDLELNYFSPALAGDPVESATPVEKKKIRSRSEKAYVYAALMEDDTVKFGYAGDMTDRVRRFKREFGKSAVQYFHSPQVPRKNAQDFETLLKKQFAPFNVEGEFFNIEFEVAVDAIKNLFPTQQLACTDKKLPVEINLFEETKNPPLDLDRAKLLVELCNAQLDSPFKEQLAKETANLLFGEKIF